VLSIGSVGSALSVGSVGSMLSAFSGGSALSVGSVLSARSRWSILSAAGDREIRGWHQRRLRSVAPTAWLGVGSALTVGLLVGARRGT
jgi:hypothetical protein